METKEFAFKGTVVNGFLMLFVNLAVLVLSIVGVVKGIIQLDATGGAQGGWLLGGSALMIVVNIIMWCGLMQLEPNEARVITWFGKYAGTFAKAGFYWINPFYGTKRLSLRARNLDVKSIMNALEKFVRVQSDAALRQVAGQYAYDDEDGGAGELTLRSGSEDINQLLEQKLDDRLALAGIEVVEARINYLAYAPEIAAVMLRRQQASAIITAREKIVDGAVSMVKMALDKLSKEGVVELDADKKAAMVSNLLVVLCGDDSAQPVVNTGSMN